MDHLAVCEDQLISELSARLAAAHSFLCRALGLSELPAELLDLEREKEKAEREKEGRLKGIRLEE